MTSDSLDDQYHETVDALILASENLQAMAVEWAEGKCNVAALEHAAVAYTNAALLERKIRRLIDAKPRNNK